MVDKRADQVSQKAAMHRAFDFLLDFYIMVARKAGMRV